jgi:hypothetical protein
MIERISVRARGQVKGTRTGSGAGKGLDRERLSREVRDGVVRCEEIQFLPELFSLFWCM